MSDPRPAGSGAGHIDDPTCPQRAGRAGAVFAALFLVALAAAMAAGEQQVYHHEALGIDFEGKGWMHAVLYDGVVRITGWKILGYIGAGLFAARWFVQAIHRRRSGSSDMPTIFWAMSLVGAGLTTMYFIWGKNDSVGIIQNALPATVAAYNLVLDLRRRAAWGGAR